MSQKELEMSKADKVVAIIMEECQRLELAEEDIDNGCEYAEFMLRGKGSFTCCILSGIAVAKGQVTNTQNLSRSA